MTKKPRNTKARRERIRQAMPTELVEHEIPIGDRVRIKGTRGHWIFKGIVRSKLSGNEWASVYGGQKDPAGQRQFHSFDPERVIKMRQLPKKDAA